MSLYPDHRRSLARLYPPTVVCSSRASKTVPILLVCSRLPMTALAIDFDRHGLTAWPQRSQFQVIRDEISLLHSDCLR